MFIFFNSAGYPTNNIGLGLAYRLLTVLKKSMGLSIKIVIIVPQEYIYKVF